MKAILFTPVRYLKNFQFWLLGIAAGLIAIHLTVTWRFGDINLLGVSVLFWLAVSSLIWRKRSCLNLESGALSSLLGALLVAIVLLKSTSLTGSHFIRLSPFLSAVGLALLASGFKGLKQYWQELTVLFFLGVPQVILSSLSIDTSLITAQFAAFILWYLGFEVSRQGVYINLPGGGVEVYPGCSGLENMAHLLGLAILFLAMFPMNWGQKILAPIVAVTLAFLVNGFRVAFMTVLAASSQLETFEYWHKGGGSLVFSLIAVLLFGLFCLFSIRQQEPVERDTA
ncbi:MAG: cyanoexosortase A [Hydrococcus sp. C42_A2020_068]|uniref:cyanoexosortase A n=1 Tax=Pleurocapsa sp. PCC 7327 TaxID=118163 RepID=UPI00029FE211|nr:cyanoexosortase A [Pleurocapsa sp. PCC 7327]AFY76746.1 exosortase, cyanobacterial variant [Pleurocapsa sp. PCC 7327]MBF2020941.1 cyanoexosortase A [Hydrococcus sp. C42_A2020_068]